MFRLTYVCWVGRCVFFSHSCFRGAGLRLCLRRRDWRADCQLNSHTPGAQTPTAVVTLASPQQQQQPQDKILLTLLALLPCGCCRRGHRRQRWGKEECSICGDRVCLFHFLLLVFLFAVCCSYLLFSLCCLPLSVVIIFSGPLF